MFSLSSLMYDVGMYFMNWNSPIHCIDSVFTEFLFVLVFLPHVDIFTQIS